MEIRYNICDRVWFFNTAACAFESDTVKDVRVIPTGISKDVDGNDVLDSYDVLYALSRGGVVTEGEVFDSEEQARGHYREVFCGSGCRSESAGSDRERGLG